MDLNQFKKIHFIGIGGIGVSAIAKMMLELGKDVSGSDIYQSKIIDKLQSLGAKINIGHNQQFLNRGVDLVVYSAAVPENNPERQKAKEQNINQLSYGEFLGALSENYKTIAITGTNGKTTTSAMLGKVLVDQGIDPTVIIGSQLNQFNGNFRLGKSEYLAIEADEYKAHMLKVKPWSILLTSIEEDHLDFYKDLNDIINHFQKFINKLPPKGIFLYNADDQNIKKLKLPVNSLSCSLNSSAGYWVKNLMVTPGNYQYLVYNQNKPLGEFSLRIPGEYNVLNSLLVIGFCQELNLDLKKVKKSLKDFGGLWRRFEILGNLKNEKNVLVVSDYTHHPAAIIKTLKAAKEFYPQRRLFLIYQPHQHNRTRKLFDKFVNSFNQADFIILNEIYDVPGRKYQDDEKISSKNLVKAIIEHKQLNENQIIYSPDLIQTNKLIHKYLRPHDLLLIMGAGDIDDLARKLK